jgi:predicted Zn-dependent peptidase
MLASLKTKVNNIMKNIPKTNQVLAEIRPLEGGGRLAIEVMPGMESFSLGFFLPVGAAYENASLSGISHFMEHMVFKGTKRRSAKAIVQAIERVGGIINASTGREATYYYVRVGAARLELALDVVTDLLFNPLLDPVAMEREKGVVIEEMRMNEDDPEQAIFDKFLMAVHGKNPYGRPIIGTEKTIRSFNSDGLWKFHDQHYCQPRLMASIAGGIDPDKAHSIIEKHLAQFEQKKCPAVPSPKAPDFRPEILAHSKDVEQAALIVGFPSVNVTSPERYAFSILDAIAAGGMMSRLFQEVREKRGLVYSIDTTHQPYKQSGLFTIEAGMHEKNILKVLGLVLKEFTNIAQDGPRKRELEDAKLYLLGHWALGLESTSARMIRNAMSTVFYNRLLSHEEVTESLNAVTRDDVAKAASKMFSKGGPAVGVLARFEDGTTTGEVRDTIVALVQKARATAKGK